jgi:lipopolysaccharide export system permease protein
MKKIDKLVLGSFMGPFFLTLFIVIFILLTQVLIRYAGDLVGKDLAFTLILEVFAYFSISLTKDAIPLAILISSLITFGNLGEHSEITAIKSAGISLTRLLAPIFLFVIAVTVYAFFNNNNIIPKANLKAYSLLWDLRQKKPSLSLKEGVFYYDIPNYAIKADKKYPDGHLKGLIIYDHSNNLGNTDVIVADSGRMYTFFNDQYLMFDLYNGYSYSEDPSSGPSQKSYINRQEIGEFFRSKFDSSKLVFSLESFGLNRTREELFANSRLMKNIKELQQAMDSVEREKRVEQIRLFHSTNTSFSYYLNGKFNLPESPFKDSTENFRALRIFTPVFDSTTYQPPAETSSGYWENGEFKRYRNLEDELDENDGYWTGNFYRRTRELSMDTLPPIDPMNYAFIDQSFQIDYTKSRAIGQSLVQARLVKSVVDSYVDQIGRVEREKNKYEIELHSKYAKAFTCIVMFLIGAPLGAIIKRGGLGLPVLVSVGFFIFYYALTILSEKWGKEAILNPFLAVWFANFMLLPIGFIFLKQARKDARLFETDFYYVIIDKLKQKFLKPKQVINVENPPEIVDSTVKTEVIDKTDDSEIHPDKPINDQILGNNNA